MVVKGLRAAGKQEEDARLKALLLEGVASGGADIPLTANFWKDLKGQARDIAAKHKSRKKRP